MPTIGIHSMEKLLEWATKELVRVPSLFQIFKVPYSLLKLLSSTLLAQIASEQWQADQREEVFLEGNDDQFQYVLVALK